MKSAAELREIAHRAGHYRQSHGDLPLVTFMPYTCDELQEPVSFSHRDVEEVFGFMAEALALLENQSLRP